MNRSLAIAALITGLATTAPWASAQNAPADGSAGRPAMRGEHMHQHGAQRARTSPTERMEARLAYVRTALKITDAQQPQWEAFANVLRRQAQQTEAFFQKRRAESQAQGPGAQRAHLTAIDRLERRQQFMTAASQRMNEVIAAAKPLYAALAPEQQRTADDLLAQQSRRFGHRGTHRG